jgi:hypothetical protein
MPDRACRGTKAERGYKGGALISFQFLILTTDIKEYFHHPGFYLHILMLIFCFVDNQMALSKLEQLINTYGFEWQAFKDSMDAMDKEAFLDLIERAKRHAEAGTKIENPNLFESVVMSILVEHQRELQLLQGILLPNQTKTCPRCSRTASIEDFFNGDSVNDGVTILCSHCKEALNFFIH